MNFRKTAIATVALGAALTMSACGSSSTNTATSTPASASASSSASAQAQGEGQFPPAPTVEQLNQELQTALNPNVPAQQKVDLVQGGQQDPQLFQKIAEKASQTQGVTYKVTGPVIDQGNGQLTAGFEITANGQSHPGQATFVAENGKWKLSKQNACAIAKAVQVQSPACPA